jgi:hypothetical protein
MSRSMTVHKQYTIPRLTYRFFMGTPMDGNPRTNSSFFHAGDEPAHKHLRLTWWNSRPGYLRAGIRLGVLVSAIWSLWVWFYLDNHLLVEIVWGALTGSLLGYAGLVVRRKTRNWSHRRNWLYPLHLALHSHLNLPRATDPDSYLSVPLDYASNPDVAVRVEVPDDFSGAEKGTKAVVIETVSAKLAIEGPDVSWRLAGKNPHVLIRVAPRPPKKVLFDAVKLYADRMKESEMFFGLGARDSVVTVNLDTESPHILVSAGTGGGKSTIVKNLLSQALHKGGAVIVCDVKRTSHRWIKDLPGTLYARSAEEIHNALIALALECERRYTIIDEVGEEAAAELFTRVFLTMEEMNATIGKLKRYWASVRENGDPKASPAVEALHEILFTGRACKVHVIAVAQMMTANALGGPEARENFSIRILSRYTVNAWKMLVPEVWPAPKSTRHIGRSQVVLGGDAHETQMAFMTDAQAREWALSGVPSAALPAGSGSWDMAALLGYQRVTPGTVPGDALTGHGTVGAGSEHPAALPAADGSTGDVWWSVPGQGGPGDTVLVSLAVACGPEGVLGKREVTLESARSARKRDKAFPKEKGKEGKEFKYSEEELLLWAGNRERAGN